MKDKKKAAGAGVIVLLGLAAFAGAKAVPEAVPGALPAAEKEIPIIKPEVKPEEKEFATQVDELSEYSADLVRQQDELVHLTQATNELGLMLERMELQARLNLRAVHIDVRPHVPGYDGDD